MTSITERLSTSRGGAVALGIGAAVLAGILLLIYLDRYRNSVQGENKDVSVLVAKRLILQGTSGTVIGGKDMYQGAQVARKDIKVGAIADPSYLTGRVATNDILPGQQLTTADFSADTTNAVNTRITGNQRALSVNVDNVHGSLSQLKSGDHIDIYIGLGAVGSNGQAIVKLFRPNVLVMEVPSADSGNLILRINNSKDAADFAYVNDHTQLWFVLRPAAGAKQTKPDTATLNTVLR